MEKRVGLERSLLDQSALDQFTAALAEADLSKVSGGWSVRTQYQLIAILQERTLLS
jgi:hypothetical protein